MRTEKKYDRNMILSDQLGYYTMCGLMECARTQMPLDLTGSKDTSEIKATTTPGDVKEEVKR